ncbi:NUDIX domain-containing protein [Sulfitobacter sp. HNIBRBA3233]|uniref:NUDIX domain-containing protein n=1 Tax=Sulfitobacter marinivivus TaxID=3158558 RepID=UPI0032DF3239
MSRSIFFYGSLRHAPLLRIVLGYAPDAKRMAPAVLNGYAVRGVSEGPFPTLVREKGADAHGLLVRGLSKADIARLDFYEGGFAYDLLPVELADGQAAEVYVSPPDRWTATGAWSLEAWVADWGEMSCHAAVEVMGYYGTLDAQTVAQRFGQIRTRAWSKVLAGRASARQGTFDGEVEVIAQRKAYSGFLTLDEVEMRHSRFAGGMSERLERSYLVGADASLVLPYDPVRDRVMMIEQVRVGPLGRGDPELWQYEPIAGRVDPGETPAEAAHREAQEEAGLTLSRLEQVGQCYASPGSTTDFFHVFVGLADLPDTVTGVGGLETEAEDIRSHLFDFAEFLEMAEGQRLVNAPLLLLCYWLAHHRKRLRS